MYEIEFNYVKELVLTTEQINFIKMTHFDIAFSCRYARGQGFLSQFSPSTVTRSFSLILRSLTLNDFLRRTNTISTRLRICLLALDQGIVWVSL